MAAFSVDSKVPCSPTQNERIQEKFQSKFCVEDADISCTSSSESDSDSEDCIPTTTKTKQTTRNQSSTSSSDSSHYDDNLTSLPSNTFAWNINNLNSLGIFYNESYHSSPLDILNIIFEELNIFGPLNEDQVTHVKNLQNSINFDTSLLDIELDQANIVQNQNGDIFLPDIERDIDNLSDPSHQRPEGVKGFLIRVQLVISCLTAFINGLSENGVSKDLFVNILETFAEMCDILPVPGSAKKCAMNIQNVNVKSTSDVVLIPKMYRRHEFTVDIASTVSVIEDKEVKRCRVGPQHKTSAMSSTPGSGESESGEPEIYQKVHPRYLGQHGGKLLVHHSVYGSILSKGRIWKYLPGIICIGTEVIFTLLKIKGSHLKELMTVTKPGIYKTSTEAIIYYSEPKDLLRKEDRDILLESFGF